MTVDVESSSLSLATAGVGGLATKNSRIPWRMLWRGGLLVGAEGFFLDGVAFFGKISFGERNTHFQSNPFDDGYLVADPFMDLHSKETDLCLSLETQRGRKALHYRGVLSLDEDEDLDTTSTSDSRVQMSISPFAVHTQHFVKTALCRSAQLTASGRTRFALVIGLGDEDLSPNSSIIVYGQQDPVTTAEHGLPVPLKLLVARKRVKRLAEVLPGEPLPRELKSSYMPSDSLDRSKTIDQQRKLGKRQAMRRSQSVKIPRNAAPLASTSALRACGTEAEDQSFADHNEVRLAVVKAIHRRSPALSSDEIEEVVQATLRGTILAMRRHAPGISPSYAAAELISTHLDMYIGKVVKLPDT